MSDKFLRFIFLPDLQHGTETSRDLSALEYAVRVTILLLTKVKLNFDFGNQK